MRPKIVTKLFIITSSALVVLLITQLLLNTFYFGKFYQRRKQNELAKVTMNLKESVEQANGHQVTELFRDYTEKSGAVAGVINYYGIPIYGFDSVERHPYVEIKNSEGKLYRIHLRGFESEELFKVLDKGKSIQVQGYSLRKNTGDIYPEVLMIDGITYKSNMPESIRLGDLPYGMLKKSEDTTLDLIKDSYLTQRIVMKGEVDFLYVPTEKLYGTAYREERLLRNMSTLIKDKPQVVMMYHAEIPSMYESMDPYTGIRSLICIIPITVQKETMLLASMIPLQEMDEAVDMMNQYFIMIFIVVAVIGIGGTYIYSKRVTRPLLELSEVTKRLSSLDFTQQCHVSSGDEIGELAKNINRMSSKLEDTLKELKQDIALKEKMEQERKRLLADISHELKTPLTVIKGTCSGLIDGIYEQNLEIYYKRILGEVDDMAELIKQLLDLSRLDKEETLKLYPFDLSELTYKVHSQLKVLAKEKHIQVNFNLEEGLVLGDESKIETVLRNLYTNAVFYSPEEAQINLTLVGEDEKMIFNIENTGVWLPEEALDQVWDAFYRVEASRNKALGGSGLGLYIVSQILEKHEASYKVYNTDKGVNIGFTLRKIEEFSEEAIGEI